MCLLISFNMNFVGTTGQMSSLFVPDLKALNGFVSLNRDENNR
ncbi:hypothetical protein SAMN05661012_04487 [Chitinophaga sancti]|uniref:Uncharacterized protein n=1 Tax=Chitinophaga sancti TaxID=1004 RepID=A0A1K1RYL9_9BACT|nr:hypothetical protein SAMN05661012_04487 [Chitinophaga sancti]